MSRRFILSALVLFHDKIVLIAISAQAFEETAERCLEAGFDSQLLKPADPRKVLNLVQELRPRVMNSGLRED
jgi:CheY-like chemotaxis protein